MVVCQRPKWACGAVAQHYRVSVVHRPKVLKTARPLLKNVEGAGSESNHRPRAQRATHRHPHHLNAAAWVTSQRYLARRHIC